VDFSSPENPIKNWGEQAESNGGNGHDHEATNGELFGKPKSALLNDSAGEGDGGEGGSDDPYELPALQRRRRQRFFE
jgi:hypothetical protein